VNSGVVDLFQELCQDVESMKLNGEY
jgi:hypothetical protein